MTYTVSQVVERALRRIGAVVGGNTVDATDAATMLTAYNAFMFGLPADGLTVLDSADAAYTHAVQALGDTFPLADKHFEGVSALVAMKGLGDFEQYQPSASLASDATNGMERLYADFLVIDEVEMPRALIQLPSRYDKGFW